MWQGPRDATLSGLEVAKRFLAVSLALVFLLSAVAAIHYYAEYETQRRTTETREMLNVELSRQRVLSDLSSVASDLLILAQQTELIYRGAPPAWHPALATLNQMFSILVHNRQVYDQARYLDNAGAEVVRVNLTDGQARVVIPSQLQEKAHRYYVAEARQLQRGEIYVSPMDLNMEGNRVEEPFKPVMRFATPVFDATGERLGLIVLNYLGERLIRHFRQAAVNIADHVHLVDERGFWLSNPDPDWGWGALLGTEHRFKNAFPGAWEEIRRQEKGQILTSRGLLSFTTVTSPALPLSEPAAGTRSWKVISQVPLTALTPLPGEFFQRHARLYTGISLLMLLLAYLLAYLHTRNRWVEAQSRYERHFRRTVENIRLAAVSVDQRGRLDFCNDYFCQLTDWERRDVIGRDWVNTFVPAAERSRISGMLARLDVTADFPARFEGEVLTRNGDPLLIAWNNTVSPRGVEGLYHVTAIGEDITQKRRHEKQLRQLSRAVEQSPSMVVITDRGGNIEYVNPKFTEVTGYRPEEVLGRNPRIMKSGETTRTEYAMLWNTISNGGEWRGEFHNRRKNGDLYWESASISGVRDRQGLITHFISVKEDITRRKRLEKIIEERNKELARSQSLAAMGRMSSMVAHDLRNPLSSVKMGLQMISKKLARTDGEAGELCQIGLEQVRYMENILSDMLSFARPEQPMVEWVAIDKLLRTTLTLLHARLEGQGILVELECSPGLPALPGDVNKLRQLFSNLITNAAQSMQDVAPEERRIRIDASLCMPPDGTFIQTRICDNGCGLENNDPEYLFEPFVTTRAKGTGLGLAIVRQIAEQHRGKVELTANQPKGSCAIIMLPTTPTEASGEAPEAADC